MHTRVEKTNSSPYRSLYGFFFYWFLILGSNQYLGAIIELFIKYLPSVAYITSKINMFQPRYLIRDKHDYLDTLPTQSIYSLEYSINSRHLDDAYVSIKALVSEYKKKSTYITYILWTRITPQANPESNLKLALNYPDLPSNCVCVFSNQEGDDNSSSDDASQEKIIFANLEMSFSKNQKYSDQFSQDVNNLMVNKFQAKPHMGKTIVNTDSVKNYDFSDLRKAVKYHDPQGIFSNDFAKKILN
jgi:hypothetical protein